MESQHIVTRIAPNGWNFRLGCTCGWTRGIAGDDRTATEAEAEHMEAKRPKTAAELFAKL